MFNFAAVVDKGSNMTNTFLTKGYAGAAYFCDREKETKDLVQLLTNENNLGSPVKSCVSNKTKPLKPFCFGRDDVSDAVSAGLVL